MSAEALDIDALCAKAQAATPGPWEVRPYTGDSDPEYVGPIAGEEITTESGDTVLTQLGCSCCDFGLEGRPEDAAHIAAFDPPTVLALIERVRAVEAENERLHIALDHDHLVRDIVGLQERLRLTEMARERTAAVLARVREAVAGQPQCDRYDVDGAISCGWKSAYASVLWALEGRSDDEHTSSVG